MSTHPRARRATPRWSRYAHGFVCLALSLLLVAPAPLMAQVPPLLQNSTPASGSPQMDEYLAASARLDEVFALIAKARSQLDRSAFDLEALLDELAYDADAIVAFVTDEIAYDAYPGLLRGPTGTLMSRAGNAIDQSVLLAKLLNDAGFEARIVEGTLSEPQARAMIVAGVQAPRKNRAVAPSPELVETMTRLASLSGGGDDQLAKLLTRLQEPGGVDEEQRRKVAESARGIEQRMVSAVPDFGKPRPQASVVEEARRYFWVQFRDGPVSEWQDVHPAHGALATDAEPPKVAATYVESVPEDVQHRVSFVAKIEQNFGGRALEHALMSPWTRPVANLVGVPVTFANHPDSLTRPGDYLDVTSALERASMFFPKFMGSLAPGAQAFDTKGRVVDPEAASNQAAGIFKKVGDAFGEATASLSGGDAVMQLTRYWLEFTFTAPDGSERKVTRTLFATAPGDVPEKMDIARKIAQEHTFMVGTGYMSDAYGLDQILARLESSQRILRAVLERSYFPDQPVQLSASDLKQVQPEWWGHYLLYPALADSARLGTDTPLYVSAPQLIMYSEEPPIGEGQRRTVDIVRNERRALQLRGDELVDAPSLLVSAGVWDTAMEGLVLSDEGRSRLDTFIAMERAPAGEARVLLPGQADQVEGLGIDGFTAANLRSDLERGYAVLVPAAAPEEVLGWWRVDPATGETLGMLYTGQGSAFTEALGLISGIISFGFWLNGMAGCVGGSENEMEFSCCVAVNSAFWIGGGIVGAYVGVTGLLASLGAFAGDMAYNIATAQLDLCGS